MNGREIKTNILRRWACDRLSSRQEAVKPAPCKKMETWK
jgi:hypothetical protein